MIFSRDACVTEFLCELSGHSWLADSDTLLAPLFRAVGAQTKKYETKADEVPKMGNRAGS